MQDLIFEYRKRTDYFMISLCTKNDNFEVCLLVKHSHEPIDNDDYILSFVNEDFCSWIEN